MSSGPNETDLPRPKFGFKFSKVNQPKSKIVQLTGLHQEEEKRNSSIDFITTIDNSLIIGTQPRINEVNKQCVIPLIKLNKYSIPQSKKEESSIAESVATVPSGDENDLDAKAKKELLNINSCLEEDFPAWKALIINKVPDTYENDNKLDVSIRPAEPTLDDYQTIPVESFGLGMLRGMGWKDGEAIGGINKRITPIHEPRLRARGLGLGADTLAGSGPL